MRIKLLFILGVFGIVIGAFISGTSVNAANAADFNPGNIIDDYVFYNANTMGADQIQTFLNSKVPNCDYNGTQPATEWGYPQLTRAQFAYWKANGYAGNPDPGFHAPPYRCLTVYTQNTPPMEAASGFCGGISARSNATAAQIIDDVAKACGINPQVLIVLLEKEQSLITDVWPLNRQLNNATGFACPDTAPCDPAFGGFFYQVYYAARQFKVYKAEHENPAIYGQTANYDYNYRAGRDNIIKWNPNSACGTSTVYIQNQATAGLYIYTPYRPNQAALNNLYGSGDSCSAYGNRNFWRIFTDWFGTTRFDPYTDMSQPRIMELTRNTYKINAYTGETVGEQLPSGIQRMFKSRITTNNGLCLQTELDYSLKSPYCILISDLTDDIFHYVDLPENEQIKTLARFGCRLNLRNSIVDYNDCFEHGREIVFVKKVYLINQWYLISKTNATHGELEIGFREPAFTTVTNKEVIEPITMSLTSPSTKYNTATGASFGDIFPRGLKRVFVAKYRDSSNNIYYQTETDANHLVSFGFPASLLEEVRFTNFSDPRDLVLNKDSCKINIFTDQQSDCFSAGLTRRFTTKVMLNGEWYFRTETDTTASNPLAFPASDLVEI